MIDVLQVLSLALVVLAMVPALAHALELPGKLRLANETRSADWTALRDRWERSHVARAVLAAASFVALAVAVSSAEGV